MMIDIEKGKTLIIRLMAVGPVIEGRALRDVWFEVNGEVSVYNSTFKRDYTEFAQVRAVSVEDNNSAVETVSRERATTDPGSVGAPMSGVVVEVRVKEGHEIKKGDPICGKFTVAYGEAWSLLKISYPCFISPECHEGEPYFKYLCPLWKLTLSF